MDGFCDELLELPGEKNYILLGTSLEIKKYGCTHGNVYQRKSDGKIFCLEISEDGDEMLSCVIRDNTTGKIILMWLDFLLLGRFT